MRLSDLVYSLPSVLLGLAISAPAPARADDKAAPKLDAPTPVEWGFGAWVRRSRVSERLQRQFVEDTPGRATQDGISVEFTRRKKPIEVVFALGYDPYHGQDGYYLELNADPTVAGKVDHVVFDKMGWITADVTAIRYLEIHKILSIRLGAGLGIGYVLGEARKTDALCTGGDLPNDCVIDPNGTQVDEKADFPPVLPVINLLAGVEFRPFRALSVHADVGLHTIPYVGAGVTLYLW